MRLLFALLSVVIGLGLVFWGYRLARIFIPLMGFLVGLSLGGAIISDTQSMPFLGTALGIFVGIMAGLLFALLAYFYYFIAVLVMAGGLGYWAGSGFVLLLGFSPGLLSVLIGIAVGILVAIVALLLNAPKYLLILLTSIAGAVSTVGGILLLFHKVPLDIYSYHTASIVISNSFWWTLLSLTLLIIGLVSQSRSTTEYDFETWGLGDHTHHLPPTTTPHHAGV